MIPQYKENVSYYDENTKGRDFVVGDLHGCKDDFLRALDLIQFDKTKDRMFSVGDLVDRGPDSLWCANLAYEDWFIPVRANHEDMMILGLAHDDDNQYYSWINNGGVWSYEYDRDQIKSLAIDLDRLPIVIVVGNGKNRFNIVHAEMLKRNQSMTYVAATDMDIDNWTFDLWERTDLMWGRVMYSNLSRTVDGRRVPTQGKPYLYQDPEQLSLTFVGHTPVPNVLRLSQQVYIDGGLVFQKLYSTTARLYIAEPNANVIHSYDPIHQTITIEEIPNVQQPV